jgi:flagellar assembly factor FliW
MTAAIDGSTRSVPPEQSMPAALSLSSTTPERTIASAVLGDVVVSLETLFQFPEGLHGFERHQEYVLVPAKRNGFFWLQSAEEPGLAFLLVDPFLVHDGFEVDLGAGDQVFLELQQPDDALVLTVVTLPSSKHGEMTTNLRGPLVLNVRTRKGRQVVRADEGYSLKAPVSVMA